MKVMRGGRARWKIENETFNTLKNQGYNFEHNYGHGKKYLATVLSFIMLIAFLVDQIQQRTCKIFRAVWKKTRTKIKLWENIRAVFKLRICKSMTELYIGLLELYDVQIA